MQPSEHNLTIVKIPRVPHRWSVTPKQAIALQRDLARRVVTEGTMPKLELVAGADLAFSRDQTECIAGVVVWDVRRQQVVEQQLARRPLRFPYVPGLLSFREAPALLAVLRKLRCDPDVLMLDGQGVAHPRRFGLACHIGVLANRATLGCAKSRLVGRFKMPGTAKGDASPLEHDGERVGTVLRTRDRVKPVFVSIGHRLSLEDAVAITLACCAGFRLPEPTRLADQLVTRERNRI